MKMNSDPGRFVKVTIILILISAPLLVKLAFNHPSPSPALAESHPIFSEADNNSEAEESPRIVILDNQLYGHNISAICIRGHRVSVKKCQIYGNGSAGLVIGGDAQVLIQENHIYDQEGAGITVTGKSPTTVTITHNQIYQNKTAGLYCGAKDQIPPHSFIRNPTLPYSYDPNTGRANNERPQTIIVQNNRIYLNGESGLKCQSEYSEPLIHLTACDNTLFRNQKGGIFIANKAKVVLSKNFIFENNKAGIAASKSELPLPQLDVFQNTIWGNAETGIDAVAAYSGPIGLGNNWIIHNGGSGIRFEATPMRIVNNTIVSNGRLIEGSGIEQKGKGTDYLIVNNILTHNSKTGFSLKRKGKNSHNLLFANDGAGNCCDDCCVSPKLIENKQFGGGKRKEGDLICDPMFLNPDLFDFRLKKWSPAIDAGIPSSEFQDQHFPPSQGGKWNDLGATGGPLAAVWDPNWPIP